MNIILVVAAASVGVGMCIAGLFFNELRHREKKRRQQYEGLENPLPIPYEEFRKHFGDLCRPVSFFVEKRQDGDVAIGWIFEDANHRRTFVPALQVVKNFAEFYEFFQGDNIPHEK